MIKPSASPENIVLANRFMERRFVVQDGVLRTTSVLNRRSEAILGMESCEFKILFLDGTLVSGTEFLCRRYELTTRPDGTVELMAWLEHPPLGLQAELVYTLGPEDFWVRKQVRLSCARTSTSPVDRLDVEHFIPSLAADVALEHQPIFFGEDFFLGLEFPGCVNAADPNGTRVSHFPGGSLDSAPLQSKWAVLGVAVSGDLLKDFNTYVERIRRKNPPFLMWNSGGLLQIYDPVQLPKESMNLYNTIEWAMGRLLEELTIKRKCPFHAFVLEPSWHHKDTLYEVDETKFPGGLRPLAEKLREAGSHLGLWFSPTTPITSALLTRKAIEKGGYAVAVNPKFGAHYPCLSFPRYFADIKSVMCRHARELNVGHYKLDFCYFDCEGEGHGHLPILRHGREANIAALIDILETLAAENPQLRIVVTSGMWLSPWWLMYADVIWPHGMMDFNYCRGPVSLNPRDWELTLRDQEFHRLLRQERGRFPFSGMLFMGMAAGPRYNVAGPNETRESYLKTLVYNMARQPKCPECYVDLPPSDCPEDWDVTAQAVRWRFDRYHRVPDGEVVLGEPAKGEVYGFRNLGPKGGILTLRNPDMRPQRAKLPVAPLDPAIEFLVEITSPYRQLIAAGRKGAWEEKTEVALGPYEAVVVEISPRAAQHRPIPAGCRYSILEESPGELVFDLFAEPGREAQFELVWRGEILSCEANGRTVEFNGKIVLPPKGARERLLLRRLTDTPAGKQGFVMQTYRLDIPDSHKAILRIVAQDEKHHPLNISVNMGGFFGGLPYRFCKGNGWTAYEIELNPRDMNVIRWGFPPHDAPPLAKLWLVRRWEMPSTRIRVTYDPPFTYEMPELPTPFAGVVWDAVCVSDVVPDVTPELRPWTDEYAQSADK